MNTVQSPRQPTVVQLGRPFTRESNRPVTPSNYFPRRSYPVLAVTRSKTSPLFEIDRYRIREMRDTCEMEQRKASNSNTRYVFTSRQISRVAPSGDTVFSPKCAQENTDRAKGTPRNHANNTNNVKVRPKSHSLPVWPVTDPATIANSRDGSSRQLPRPRLSIDYGFPRGKTAKAVRSETISRGDSTSNGDTADGNQVGEVKVNVKHLPRCKTPKTEYDPDRLNIKQVVEFLGRKGERKSGTPNMVKEIPFVETAKGKFPNPLDLTFKDTGHRNTKSANSASPVKRRSPVAARRYLKSAKTAGNEKRGVSQVSSREMSMKRHSTSYDSRQQQKIRNLTALAARYNPGIQVNDVPDVKEDQETRSSMEERSNRYSEEHFGPMKYRRATFHSFPTNQKEPDIGIDTFEKRTDTDEGNTTSSDIVSSSPDHGLIVSGQDEGATGYNATDAIRLPSVYDNLDSDNEGDETFELSLPSGFRSLKVTETSSQGSRSPVSPRSVNGEWESVSKRQTPVKLEYRHSRNLALVLSRERSREDQWYDSTNEISQNNTTNIARTPNSIAKTALDIKFLSKASVSPFETKSSN